MKIVIDCQGMQSFSRNRGIGRYALDFVNQIIKNDFSIEIVLLINAKLPQNFLERIEQKNKNNIEIRTWIPLKNSNWLNGNQAARKISEDIYLGVIKSLNADIYLVLSPFEGLNQDIVWIASSDTYNVAIYYDAIPRIYKNIYLGNKHILKWYSTIESRLNKFDQILGISNTTAADAAKFLQIDNSKINTIFFGVDVEGSKPSSVLNDIKEEFVLAVLGEDKRKNKENLLYAWKEVNSKLPNLRLKIVYKQSELEKISNSLILKEINLGGMVEFLDFITEEKLQNLYNECTFTIFPSLYEGLGLPILESYLYQKACLTSDRSAMRELVTLSELKFDPSQPIEIANRAIDLYANNELRQEAIQDGKKILSKFSSQSKKNQIERLLHNFRNKGISKKKVESNRYILGVYFHTILKPTQSGVANFAENLIHPLHSLTNLVIVNDSPVVSNNFCPTCNDAIRVISPSTFHDTNIKDYVNIHNIGNSTFHTWQIEIIGQYPGLILMHDGYLSGLMWKWLGGSIAKDQFIGYAIQETSALNFMDLSLYNEPHLLIQSEKLNEYFLESANSIVVHNTQCEDILRKDYCFKDNESINVIPLPIQKINHKELDSRHKKIIGVFGIIAETKMFEELIQSWKLSKIGQSKEYILRFIGKNLSSEFKKVFIKNSQEFNIEYTDFVSEEEYWNQMDLVKFAIQLRRQIRGESSGAIVDLMSFGIPIISNILFDNEMASLNCLNLVSHEFTAVELANKIDWVNNNISVALDKADLGKKRLEIEADPLKIANRILEIAYKGHSKNEFLPISQFKKMVSELGNFEDNGIQISEIADICLESFPPTFRRIRIVVVLREMNDLDSKNFKKVLERLKSQFSQISHLPIFFCKTNDALGHLETVNRIFFDNVYMDLLDNAEFRIRIQDSDIVFGSRNTVSSLNCDPSLAALINSELGVFFESTR